MRTERDNQARRVQSATDRWNKAKGALTQAQQVRDEVDDDVQGFVARRCRASGGFIKRDYGSAQEWMSLLAESSWADACVSFYEREVEEAERHVFEARRGAPDFVEDAA